MKFSYIVLAVLIIIGLSSCTQIGGGGESTSLPTENNQPPITSSPTIEGIGNDIPTPDITDDFGPFPTETVSVSITPTIVPTPTPHYVVQSGTPKEMVNFIRPELSCNWMGIGGQVFGAEGVPVEGLIVEVGGTLAGIEISQLAITGNAYEFGPGGYLVELGSSPVASDGTLWLQLLLDGKIQSEKIDITTSAECERNLLLVNFSESLSVSDIQVRLPIIIK